MAQTSAAAGRGAMEEVEGASHNPRYGAEMTFKAIISDASVFRDSLTAMAELVAEGIFHATPEGLTFTATDPMMVTLVDFKFLAKAFDEYKTEGKVNLPLNLENLISVLKRAKAGDKITLEADKAANKLVITLKGEGTRRFTIPILDLEEAKPPEMKLDFPTTLEIRSQVLIEGLDDAAIITDTVVLATDANSFKMIAEGDLSKVESNLEKGASEALVKLIARGATKSKFSLDYLRKIVKAAKISDIVKIELGTDYPVRLSFKAPNKCEMTYVLAPRVED